MGGTLCTKSVTPSRIQENFNVWDFKWVKKYQATLQAILYPKNFLYLFDRLTDEDMAVMDSLVSIVVSCIQLPQNVGGICPQEYRNSFWKLDVTLIWGALPQNVGWRHLLWAETSLHPDYPFKVQRYTCHHHTIVIATFTVTITSNMWFPIYRIASHMTTRFRSLVLEPPLEPSSWWCKIFLCWSDFSIGKETTPVSAEIYETGPSFLNFPHTPPFHWWLWLIVWDRKKDN